MEYKFISAKCITYGRVGVLEEAISSFLQQDYPQDKCELIVVNDYPLQKLELPFDVPNIKIYNLDNGTNKNELRIKEVHSAYEALSENKYKEERPLGDGQENFDPKIEVEKYNQAFFDFLNKTAIVIDLKKSDNKVVKIDNHYVNFNCEKLDKSKFVLLNRVQVIKFEKD